MDAERLGPAFDSNLLRQPTGRKLAGCWMEYAGLRTLVLPKVWDELTPNPEGQVGSMTAAAWIGIRNLARTPFRWAELTQDQLRLAYEIRSSFTEGCFLGVPSDRIHRHPDAIITSQALALGTDALVSGDVRSINHYEVNDIVAKRWGSNTGFVLTFDDAIMRAHPSGQAAEQLLIIALCTIVPDGDWSVDQAKDDLTGLCDRLRRTSAPMLAGHLENRWWCADDLDAVVEKATRLSRSSDFMRIERLRAHWHRSGVVDTTRQ